MSIVERKRMGVWIALLLLSVTNSLSAQVHHHKDGRPWNDRADGGPDAVVPGWFYNLGITGLRVELLADQPTVLAVRYVFEASPAHGKVEVGDWIVGAGGRLFVTPHRNGYGMDKFGAAGPVLDFAVALEACQGKNKKTNRGKLRLDLVRDEKKLDVILDVGTKYGQYAKGFPKSCAKSDLIYSELLEYLARHQQEDGSWGSPPHDTFAPLALLASGDARYLPLVEKNVRMHARTTKAKDSSWLINWRYMAAAIVMSEYYLATGEDWLLPELQEVYDFLISSQFIDASQVAPKTKEDRPEDLPKDALDSHGGWGHNPGFEGYGPISMLTGQGALAFSLLSHCGIAVDRERHDFAYHFLDRGTGPNGYVWYEDQVAGARDWADMGRTGAAGVANFLSPYADEKYAKRARDHAKLIGEHPESFPDTHGSPVMGMGYAALAAAVEPAAFRRLMDLNRWWFILAQCSDGSFYYQPNRDNAGYGRDSRISATAVTALIYSIPKRNLAITGKKIEKRTQASEAR